MVQDDGLVFYNMVSSSDKLGCHIWVYVSTATWKLNIPVRNAFKCTVPGRGRPREFPPSPFTMSYYPEYKTTTIVWHIGQYYVALRTDTSGGSLNGGSSH